MDVLSNRKCGEIVVTVKNKSKKVYSFNCLFCDAICLQLKKFTTHLEQEHEDELDVEAINLQNSLKEGVVKEETEISEIFMPAIKHEICPEEIMKIELTEDEPEKKERRITRQSKKNHLSSLLQTSSKQKTKDLNSMTISIIKSNESDKDIFSDGNDNDCHQLDDDYGEQLMSSNEENSNDTDTELFKQPKSTKPNVPSKPGKLNDKRILDALIEFYKLNPLLWDNEHPHKNNLQLKRDTLQNFTKDLNGKFKTRLNSNTLSQQLDVMVRDYSKELEKKLKDETYVSELWFYYEMEFLKSQIEKKLKKKRVKIRCRSMYSEEDFFCIFSLYPLKKPLSNDIFSHLLDIYKEYDSLWDVNNMYFTIREKRRETLNLMSAELKEKLNLELDITNLKRQLFYLHKIFAKEKLAQLHCDEVGEVYESTCPFYDKCEFLQNNQGPFRCTHCQEILDSYNKYQVHLAMHENRMPFKCPLEDCELTFKKISNYSLHVRRHLKVFKHFCNICGKGFPVTSELNFHVRYHTGINPFLCSVCGEAFRAPLAYDNHMRRHENRFKYRCHICQRGFNKKARHEDHVKGHLNVRDVLCSICGKGFTSRKYMIQHKRIHGTKTYVCNICGKAFAQDSGLRAHKRNHGTPLSLSKTDKYGFLNDPSSSIQPPLAPLPPLPPSSPSPSLS